MAATLKYDKKRRTIVASDCPNCGGTHFGTPKCPFTKAPCVICGDDTIMACSDCAIDTGKSVHVCTKSECRDRHESRTHGQGTRDQ